MDLRQHFPVTREWSFLDHAGVSAASGPAAAILHEFTDDILHHGVTRVGHWVDRCEDVRRLIGSMIHADPSQIAFVKNTTEAIDFVAEGFPWQPGDNIVLPADEYPSNQYPWMNLRSRGVEVRRVPNNGLTVDLAELDRAIDSRTRILAISWVGYASGFCLNLADAAELVQSRGVALCVDVIQGFGALPLDLQQTPIDFVCCGSHKWALGYQGAGFLYVRPELMARLRPQGVGAHSVINPFDYANIDFSLQTDARRFEGGTLSFGIITAWGGSLKLLHGLTASGIETRIRELTRYLCESAKSHGIQIHSDPNSASGIVSLTVPGRDSGEVMKQARAAGVVVNHRGGRVRVAPHCYNNREDLDRLLEVLTRQER
ncbi:MAG: aminotransferase class V-fold PLP-dependent enzyme [Gemmataceae bacterium]|nr:aminotransferase class V-fold PLP-dependent enzyme [Gemmataceae bacterium]